MASGAALVGRSMFLFLILILFSFLFSFSFSGGRAVGRQCCCSCRSKHALVLDLVSFSFSGGRAPMLLLLSVEAMFLLFGALQSSRSYRSSRAPLKSLVSLDDH